MKQIILEAERGGLIKYNKLDKVYYLNNDIDDDVLNDLLETIYNDVYLIRDIHLRCIGFRLK